MPTLNAGQKSSFALQIGRAVTLAASTGSGSVVQLALSNGGEPLPPVPYNGAALTFGPYNSIVQMQVFCDSGTIPYSFATAVGSSTGPSAQTANVSSASGIVYNVTRLLGSTSTLALIAGTNSNLTINATTGAISAASGIASGTSQVAEVRESLPNGIAIEYPVTLTGTGAVVTPQLTANPTTQSIAANVAAGTLVFAISNVPANVTPTVSPNDGRFVVAGDATNGWKVVVGMSALSAGSVNVTANATGATSVSVPVTITAAIIYGTAATTASAMGATPTVQYHPNTATPTFLGGLSNIIGSLSGGTLTVTGWSGSRIALGMFLGGNSVIQDGRRILTQTSSSESDSSLGGAGVYTVTTDAASTLAAGSTMTASGQDVLLSLSERNGGLPWTFVAPNYARLLAETSGRKFVRIYGYNSASAPQSGRVEIPNLDSHNQTWVMVGRNHSAKGLTFVQQRARATRMLGVGNKSGSPYIQTQQGTAQNILNDYGNYVIGTGIEVTGISYTTADGVGGSSVSVKQLFLHNNLSSAAANANVNRYVSETGINLGGGPYDCYEVMGFTTGQVTSANAAALAPQIASAAFSNFGLKPQVKRIPVAGDSRTEENYGGNQLASLLTEPGSAYKLDDSIQVVNIAQSGSAISGLNWIAGTYRSILDGASRLSANDQVILWEGVNDISTDGVIWPTTNTTANTTARADEVFNSTGLDAQITGRISGQTLTIDTITSGKVLGGPLFVNGVYAGVSVGQSGLSNANGAGIAAGGTATLDSAAATVSTATPMTVQWGSVAGFVATLLSRGYLVGIATDIGTSSSASYERLRNHIRNDLLPAVIAGPGQTYDGKVKIVDLTKIQQGGSFIWGDNIVPANVFRDLTTHPTDAARQLLFSGADTPQYGWKALAA